MEPPRRPSYYSGDIAHAPGLKIDGEVKLQRRPRKHDHARSIPSTSLARLWERRDIDVREGTLWRLFYETAVRADEILRLDVEISTSSWRCSPVPADLL
jgi:integrase